MRLIITTLLLISSLLSFSQTRWDLKTCVEYAMTNNISVKQSELQAKNAAITYRQSKLSMIPGLNFGGSESFNSGSTQDPSTFTRVTQNYLSTGFQLQSSTDIFNFFSKRNTIMANQWEWMASAANVKKLQYDVALSAANAYLQVLLAKEQEKIAQVQIEQTSAQLATTRKMVDAGSLPELNASQLEAQLAADSGNYIAAKGNYLQATLGLKALMNIDAAQPFEVEAPPVETIPVESIADLQPDFVFGEALKNQPQQQGNAFRIKAAGKQSEAARASLLPSVSAFGSLGSNYIWYKDKPYYNKTVTGYQSTGLVADAGNGVLYDVQSPILTNGNVAGYIKANPFFDQLSDNFRKSVGLSINVPIFNGGNLKAAYERSKINLLSANLQQQQDDQKLKQDIYQAYNAALTALEKNNAAKKSVDAGEKTYLYATKRFNIGALSTFDLITAQNNLLKARLEYSISRFDYVFKMKVLEFYKGAGLKL